jgi:MFS transporter, DHA2 family, multidrug resistance protein
VAAGDLDPLAPGSLWAVVQRWSNVLAYGFWLSFWLAIVALGVVGMITRAPPGPFAPAAFGAAQALIRRLV